MISPVVFGAICVPARAVRVGAAGFDVHGAAEGEEDGGEELHGVGNCGLKSEQEDS